ncbi:FAD-dependent oxidoreductase [Cellulomonas soli]|uniref:Pyridine nucleotide-disulfide oxidoreductase n=1 Tax=Cellulomonas soli TaxID=931535 RepID=A0A512P9Z9_9CELL|nr:FAD-dependent oxidoreductase [Cellulomonas soli]NYI60513.1 NADPH-dependent 2,4-dienoyl-CoA reductase/sulfur reductase-like enzyme/peroxiredoxin family protein/TusA-related sulfurtransferase/rhodanese-related sulfurtransferase [Cellulomonas soli]GEP68028.1 pyridine nucleotide-disulfide oxidoreductase [Cellulomonas soli]
MKIVVVGGVAAGASVAARARRLDEFAEIVVLERGHHVSFANCGLPYHIGEVITERSRLLLQTPQSLRESLDIDVRVGAEVVAIDRQARTVTVREVDSGRRYTETYDALALCPGSEPVRPPLPGIDHEAVQVLRRIGDMDTIKARLDAALAATRAGERGPVRTVVIGAGYIGLEMAENLHHRGAEVHVVEMADQILPPLDREMSVPVEHHLRSRGIELHLSTAAAAFTPRPDGGVTVELTSGQFLPADLVVLAAGVRPSTTLAVAAGLDLGEHGGIAVDEHMRTSDPHIWAAGDAVETPHTVLPGRALAPLAGPANRQARVAAENICGRDTRYRSTQGTSIVKVFDMVAGGTGATERQLTAAHVPYRAVHVHPSGHAGYYPGTAMMNLKVLFAPDTGRILGAQAAGFDGVDKRLDVLAGALRAEQSVYDLEELELAYAPPFGSAKDPVNMAGFVASNVLRGDLTLWYAQDYPAATAGARIIDVRTPEEFSIWHLPGAENVPLAVLREQCTTWDTSTPVRLYCAVGFRSYLAHRALVQRGFTDVATLSGGSTTFRAWHELEPDADEAPAPVIAYAESLAVVEQIRKADALAAGTGVSLDLDCSGLACPGPIMKLAESIRGLADGDEVVVTVSDPGFANDAPAWARRNGHQLVALEPRGPGYVATFRKGAAGATPAVGTGTAPVTATGPGKTSFVVFSGDLDKVLAAFIIANGAVAMGEDVSMFFTFWGLNTLRRQDPPARERSVMDTMFGAMMPRGADKLTLSQLHMAGAGTAMIKKVMRDNAVPTLPELIASAQAGGARLIACTMTMDLLGIAAGDLLDGVELGGVATFLGEANESGTTLFI